MSEGSKHNPTPPTPKIPRGVVFTALILVSASWIPLAMIALARVSKSTKPRVHIFQDMDAQPRYGAQDTHPMMADGRAMRTPPEGAVSRGGLEDDDHYFRGYETDGNLNPVAVETKQGETYKWFATFPERVKVAEVVDRGRQRYDIFCAVCHGHAGFGDGMAHRRALALGANKTGWVTPANLHQKRFLDMPVGQIYHTIRHGKVANGNVVMPAYGSQIPTEDRWAIVAYVRALQWSQHLPADLMPAGLKQELDGKDEVEDPAPAPAEGPAIKLTAEEVQLIPKGKELFKTKICFTCHQVDPATPAPAGAALKAPQFLGSFWGTEREVHVGGPTGPVEKVVLDDAYFAESVKQPMVKIVKGSVPGMAPLPTTDEEVEALRAYVKSLSENVSKP